MECNFARNGKPDRGMTLPNRGLVMLSFCCVIIFFGAWGEKVVADDSLEAPIKSEFPGQLSVTDHHPGVPLEARENESEVVRAVSHNVSISIGANAVVPRQVQVAPGTTVVWVNDAGSPVVIRFTSDAVSTTCKAPRGFAIGPAGIYVSERISGGEVASLCFLEPQEYDYEVEYFETDAANPSQVIRGRVLVGG